MNAQKFSPAAVGRDGGTLFVGRLLPHKGVGDLIRGLPEAVPLTIVGPEPDADTKARLLALALGKAVTFLHGLDDEAVVREYRRAMCVVLPSVYRTDEGHETRVPELLGQTLLKGMSCGAPALCTAVASLPEVVEHGVTGFVVPPNDPAALGDRLSWLRAHPADATGMGLAGGSWCSNASRGRASWGDVSTPMARLPPSARFGPRCSGAMDDGARARTRRRATPADQGQGGSARSLHSSHQGASGSRKFVVDLPANRLGPGWKRRLA